jgi:hypothetical protein
MLLEQLAEKVKDELSGYKLAGYVEVCVPFYKRSLECFMQTRGQLPVVTEFVLHFINLDLDLNDISAVMGLDYDIIEQVYWDLVHHEFIDMRTKQITERGSDYLTERRLDKIDQLTVPVCIDTLLETVKMDNSQLMKSHNVKDLGLRAIKPLINEPDAETIDFDQIKKVINDYKKIYEEYYEGDLLEVVNVNGSRTEYRRLRLILYSNDDGHTRIAAYDGLENISAYESVIIKSEQNGFQILKPLPVEFPTIDLIVELGLTEFLDLGKTFEYWSKLMEEVKNNITFILPLIDCCTPQNSLIDKVLELLNRGIAVNIIASGREYSSKYQRAQYFKLLELQRQYFNLKVKQIPAFINKLVIADNLSGSCSKYSRITLSLPQSKEGYVEQGYYLTKNDVDVIYEKYISSNSSKKEIELNIDLTWIKAQIRILINLVNIADELLKKKHQIGWLGDEVIPHVNALNTIPLARNEETFKTFINAFNQSFSEVIDFAGKKGRVRNYFWKEFKNICPEDLFKVLSKTRMYRHSVHHISIDDDKKAKYYSFLDEDLDGCLPEFIPNGYLYLQVKLIKDLERELKVLTVVR